MRTISSIIEVYKNIRLHQQKLIDTLNMYPKLRSGKYYTNIDGKLSLENECEFNKSLRMTLLGHIKYKKIKINNSAGKYDKMLISKNNHLKFFDYYNNRVLTIMDLRDSEDLVFAMDQLKGYRNTFIKSSAEGIYEKLIIYEPIRKYSFKAQKRIYISILNAVRRTYSFYNEYGYIQLNHEINSVKDHCDDKTLRLLEFLDEKSKEVSTVPKVFQHCDIHFENILVENKEIFFIDFEYARSSNFLYDVLNCAYVEFVDNDNVNLTKWLFSSDYDKDKVLGEIFEVIGMRYNRMMMKTYFYRFLISRVVFDLHLYIKDINGRYFADRYTKFIKFIGELDVEI